MGGMDAITFYSMLSGWLMGAGIALAVIALLEAVRFGYVGRLFRRARRKDAVPVPSGRTRPEAPEDAKEGFRHTGETGKTQKKQGAGDRPVPLSERKTGKRQRPMSVAEEREMAERASEPKTDRLGTRDGAPARGRGRNTNRADLTGVPEYDSAPEADATDILRKGDAIPEADPTGLLGGIMGQRTGTFTVTRKMLVTHGKCSPDAT